MLSPFNQTDLFGLDTYFNDLKNLYDNNNLPNKILFSGLKGSGKSTLSLHLINYILSKDEEHTYDFTNFKINKKNRSFNLVKNNSSPNLYLIDVKKDKKNIEINQIRELINFCNKSSFNSKPRFILIDNIELMNLNSNNALLKILEEPNANIFFILINNSKKVLPTIYSRCLNFRISLTHKEYIDNFNNITKMNVYDLVNKDLLSHYFTTGDIFMLYQFSIKNNLDLLNINLENFLLKIIDESYYKKEIYMINLIYVFIQMYFLKNISLKNNYEFYNNFVETIDNIKRYNLDVESLFIKIRRCITNE